MVQTIKTLLPLAWMGLIFILSGIPADSFPAGTTSAQQSTAHVFLYSVLSYLIMGAVLSRQTDKKRNSVYKWKLSFFAVIFCVLYGITDEYHQGYVPGRFVSFSDLGVDAFGAVLGVLFYRFFKF